MYASRASGANFGSAPGPTQFQVRMLEAILHARQGGLRMRADCTIDGPWADCGLHFGHIAM
eukprot:12778189-Alexandrium_andersonii.AAC.1